MESMIKAGETKRFDCDSCLKEFEVTYEPKAKDSPSDIEPAEISTCPFCGTDNISCPDE